MPCLSAFLAVGVSDRSAPKVVGRWTHPNRKDPNLPGACVGSVAVGEGVIYAAVGGEGYFAVKSPRAKRRALVVRWFYDG